MSKRILIAEDDLVAREVMVSIATAHGYDVVAAVDGVDILYISADEKFDVIITDIVMPHLNGASAIEILKMQNNTTPVIVLTALSPSELLPIQDSVTKIFHKPCDINELFEYVELLIGK